MTNNEKIAMALKSDYLSELSVFEALPDSRLRLGFDRQMKKMINKNYVDTSAVIRHRRVKMRIAIAVIIAATAALATGSTILLKHWDTFAIKENSKYSLLMISDAENSPHSIETYYEPDFDKTGLIPIVFEKSVYGYGIEYKSEDDSGRIISYLQSVKEMMEKAHLGTEDAQVPPEKIEFGNISALYYVTHDGSNVLIWDDGEYIFHISTSGYTKEETVDIAMSLKAVKDK